MKHNKAYSPKFFYTHESQKDDINVQQNCSSNNGTHLFTKALLASTFKKLIHQTEMHRLNDLW